MAVSASGRGISIGALVVATVALIVGPLTAVIVPGPQGSVGLQGPTGLEGPQGPPGPGAIVSEASANETLSITGTGLCVNYPGILVWLNTTGPGTIVLTATATVIVSKVSVTTETPNLAVFIGDLWSDCRQDPYFATVSMPGDTAGSVEVSVALQEVLAVSSAGTHSFCINAKLLTSGGNPATILRASLLGIFYPA